MMFRTPVAIASLLFASATIPARAASNDVAVWLTTPDKTNLLTEQSQHLSFVKSKKDTPALVIDDKTRFQTMDGFGYALTGGTAQLMMKMSPAARATLPQGTLRQRPRRRRHQLPPRLCRSL